MSNLIDITGQTTYFAGDAYIAGQAPGIVTVDGTPAIRSVELRERQTRRTIAVTNSGIDGSYLFKNLDPTYTYDLIARDSDGVYNDVIAANVTPHTDEMRLLGGDAPVSGVANYRKIWKIIGGIRPYTVLPISLPDEASLEIITDRFVEFKSENPFVFADAVSFNVNDSSGQTINLSSHAPKRYWRVRTIVTSGATSFAEIEMTDALTGANLCVGGSAFASSEYSGTTTAAKAFDGVVNDADTYSWAANTGVNGTGWIAYRFATPVNIREVRISPRMTIFPQQYPTTFAIDNSSDGENWETVKTFSNYVYGWARNYLRPFDLLGPDDQYTSLKLRLDNNLVNEVTGVSASSDSGGSFSDTVFKYGTHSYATNNALDSGVTVPNTALSGSVFTFEGWFRFTTMQGPRGVNVGPQCTAIFSQPVHGPGGEQGLEMLFESSVWKFSFIRSGTRGQYITPPVPLELDVFHHIAFCCNGSTTDLFLNGVKIGTFPIAWYANNTPVQIGYSLIPAYPTYRYGFNGFIDSVRITDGKVLYTTDFTPENW